MFLTVALVTLGAVINLTEVHGYLQSSQAQPAKVRIGVYDNRSVAIAYAASVHNPVKEKMKEYEKAKAAADTKKTKELEAWGEHHQQVLHFQGFGRVPVSDLLEPVKAQVRGLAKSRGLAAITMACDYSADDVELVDVTEDLVKLYNPTAKTLNMALGARKANPVDLVEISKIPAKN